MTPEDLALLLAGIGGLLIVLVALTAIAEWWDPLGERRDARRRNGR